jgi:hypothetical protein
MSLQDGARVLHDEVHTVVMSHIRDQRMASMITADLCRWCTEHSAELLSVDRARAESVARDAGAVLAAALHGGKSIDDLGEYSRRFAADSVSAALRNSLSGDEIAAMRSGWDICAQATVAALRHSNRSDAEVTTNFDTESSRQLIDRTIIAAVEQELRLNRALVGNSYCPALVAMTGIPLPDPVTAQQVIQQMIEAAVGQEKRRVGITGTLLGEHLQTAREEVSRRRIISTSVKVTLVVFMQWCASGAQSPD